MSDTQIGPVEEIPVRWEPTGNKCPACGQDQFKGYQNGVFIGTCCPNSHWFDLGEGFVIRNTEAAVEQAQPACECTQPAEPESVGTPKDWMKALSDEQIELINQYQDCCSQLTANLKEVHNQREAYRQAIADMTCPFVVGMQIETGTGQAPKDRKVITLIKGGNTGVGEFWRAWCRVLKKNGKLGDKPYKVHPSGKGFRIIGMYSGIEGIPKESIEEDMII